VGLCGELTGEPLATFLLPGLGGFSMTARSISPVKQSIRRYASEQGSMC